MKRLKLALKAAMVYVIIGLVAVIIGIVLLIIGVATDTAGLAVAGGAVALIGIGLFYFAYLTGKQRLHAICPECQKFMGDSDRGAVYSYECNQYKENYDNTGKFRDYTFLYTCRIKCPHCGSTSTFEYKTNAKTNPKANASVEKYLKATLKLNK